MPEARLLIAEDEPLLRETLAACLRDAGYTVATAADGDTAHAQLAQTHFDLLLTDLKMPGKQGLDLVRELPELSPGTLAIVITGFATIATAVEVMKCGAYDYLTKPVVNSEVVLTVHRALEQRRQSRALALYRYTEKTGTPQLIGECPAQVALRADIVRVAGSDATVLLRGESGTGKEVVAGLLHRGSARAAFPLVAINCASLPEHLLESELFGHARGAFTGATEDKTGLFEMADGGAVFLDEIGEMSSALQARLLRVLEERQFRRVGGTRTISVNIRFLAATNRDLAQAMAAGTFRADLYYRLNVVCLSLAPLRERGDDVLLLAEHCLTRLRIQYRRPQARLTGTARAALLAHIWPGNVRELNNCLERALLLSPYDDLTPEYMALTPDLAPAPFANRAPVDINRPLKEARQALVDDFEQSYLTALMAAHAGNITRAAEQAGLSRLALREKLQKYHLHVPPRHDDID